MFELLEANDPAGIELTESYAMYPAASVSGWYFSHLDARYFGVGKVDEDQSTDYAERKELTLESARQRLQPVLPD